MKRILLAIALVAAAGSPGSAVGKTEHLSHGYWLKHREVDLGDCKNCLERIAHYQDLYWRSKRIGIEVGACFISPTGEYALFEESGKLVLFVKRLRSTREVTDGEFAIPKDVVWDEKDQTAVVTYYEKHGPSTIQLTESGK